VIRTIKTVLVFLSILRVIWLVSRQLVLTSGTTKALAAEANIAALAQQVANLNSGQFQGGISIGGDLLMNGNHISNVTDINTGGQNLNFHCDIFMNGHTIHP